MSGIINGINALEILDSRGNPTVRVYVELECGIVSSASVPSGASTGENEAVELRDGNKSRYGGKGVLIAVDNVRSIIAPELIGMSVFEQADIDKTMCDLDATPNKSKLGANAILGVSMAVAKAAAMYSDIPLYKYLGGSNARRVPVPCMNILNGGSHADNSVDIQEFMVVPHGAPTFSEGLRYATETFHELKKLLKAQNKATSVGDEGGFAPDLDSNEEAMELIVQAIQNAGYKPGIDISLALDSAASEFLAPNSSNIYDLKWSNGGRKTSDEMIQMAKQWCEKYPIISWEDPLGENDWEGFEKFTKELGDKIEVVGDDLFVTNTKYISKGMERESANAVLIKLNQIGTVTQTIDAIKMCKDNGWRAFISHRSGETGDTFIADLAVAFDAGHIKTGSSSRGERIEKYNRLLEIEAQLGDSSQYFWK
ncbi:MAG: phosphopyruvate hydratase [Campylobacterota bacterium]|nr:phosphopyruvate hydratase [Campylobacterota bacterium]